MRKDWTRPEVPPASVRTPPGAGLLGSSRCPVCQAAELRGRQTVCSARRRRERSRRRPDEARRARDEAIRRLLEAALRVLNVGGQGDE